MLFASINAEKYAVGHRIGYSNYRYGFNGMESDDEVKGAGNSYDFGARMYDARIGRFMSLDKFKVDYPNESNYVFAGNSVLMFKDFNGDFKIVVSEEAKNSSETEIKVQKLQNIIDQLPQYLEENPRVMEELKKQTGLSKEQILHDVTSGQGPTITIGGNGDGDIYARNSDEIYVDFKANDFLENFEAGDKMEQAAVNLIFAGIIIHEYTHVGDMKTNGGDITGAHWDGHFRGKTIRTDEGAQKSSSLYQHRGIDVEVKMHGISGGIGVGTDELTGGVGKIATEDIQDVISKITLKLNESIKLKNVLPKDQQ